MTAESGHFDPNFRYAMQGLSNDAALEPRFLRVDPSTNRLLVDAGSITTSSASDSATGAAVPAQASYMGGNKAGNLQGLLIGQQTMANSLGVVLASDQSELSVNMTKIGGVAPSVGNGAGDTGTQRVTLSSDSTGVVTLTGLSSNNGDTQAFINGLPTISQGRIYNGATWDRMRTTSATLNAASTGLAAAVAIAQFDDVSPTSITENSFGNLRMSTNRNLYGTIRDAAGNERGVNVNSNNELTIGGGVAHGSSSAGSPLFLGADAIAHGTNPTAVSAGQRTKLYANRAGVPFVMGGHPNIVTVEAAYTAAQTNQAIVTVATGLKIVVTSIQIMLAHATTVDVSFRVGFATATTPTTTGVVVSHPGLAPGSGVVAGDGSGIIGIGADDEDLRITSDVPTTGSLRVVVKYYTIES
jgi:hypothetical protein